MSDTAQNKELSERLCNRVFPRRSARNIARPIFKFSLFRISKLEPLGVKFPAPRSGHRIVADTENVYSFGGYNPRADLPDEMLGDLTYINSYILFKELWQFNVASRRWRKLTTTGEVPNELASHAVTLIGKCMFVFGGTGVPFGDCSSNKMYVCNLETLEWQKMETDGALPLPQYGQAMAAKGNKLYVVGGTTGFEYSMNVHCLDLEEKNWTEMHTVLRPEPRYRHEIVIEDGKIFVFGGGTVDQSFSLAEIPAFSLNENSWFTLSTSEEHPAARRCHGCVRVKNDVYISGGCNGTHVFPDIWSLNLDTMTWRKLPCTLPEPVYFHGTAVSPEGQMFIFGGVTDCEANNRTNNMYSMWLRMPSLKEMCWQAMLYYVPNIAQMNRSALLRAGIPRTFVDRVDYYLTQ